MDNSGSIANAEKKSIPRQAVLDVGMTLREAREGMGLSVHDIANRIKFAPRQVEALEANDFENLPQTTFLRGFVRSYARVLQLDEAALISALPTDAAAQTVAKSQVVDVAFPTLLSLQRVNLLWFAGALGVAFLLGLFVFMRDSESKLKPTEVVVESVALPATDAAVSAVADTEIQPRTEETVKDAIPLKEPEPVVSQKKPEPVAPQKKPEPVVIQKKPESVMLQKKPEPVKITEPVVKPVPQAVAVSKPVTDTKSAVPLETLMRRPLHFVFGEAMFAEVIDARGGVLLSRNVPRGSEKWIGGPGRAPYDISISNPRKVKLFYKGKEIDLSGYPATETVHLKVK